MKSAVAAILVATATLVVSTPPVSAESSYWSQRWRSRDATPEYDRADERRRTVVVKRRVADDRRAVRRRHVERYEAYGDAAPRPFRFERNDGRAHPTMNNDYWLQSSIYDFHAGKAADIKQYRY